ncbi:hypothetical protein AV530_006475 [Patagioenas fasciata monilis]|uniref:Uncharacterized protein n=1 Tax=Patagioenas fasciata monilis TaxID=372326 RepID=A0A1V4KGM6_PATFA|nr:hypothetical protein AV530_006475 [Patagioenas fasciata monilis]
MIKAEVESVSTDAISPFLSQDHGLKVVQGTVYVEYDLDHLYHVFLLKATDPVLCIPGASNVELPPPFLIPFHAPSHSTSRFNKEAVLQMAMRSKETAQRRDLEKVQSENHLASQICIKMPSCASD